MPTQTTLREAWAPRIIDHTFQSGRSARIHAELPMMDLVRRGVWTDDLVASFETARGGRLKGVEQAVALSDAIVVAMMVEPRITLDDDGDEDTIPISWLADDEITELMEAAFGGAATDSFPGERSSSDASGSGEVLGDDAEPAVGGGGDVERVRGGRAVDAPVGSGTAARRPRKPRAAA